MALFIWLVAIVLAVWLFLRPKPIPRWITIVLLVLFTILTLLVSLGSRVILLRFGPGHSAILLPFRMLMPAYVWPLCCIAALCGLAGIALFLQSWRLRRRFDFVCGWSLLLVVAGFASGGIAADYIARVTTSHDPDFASAFGPDWQDRITERTPAMLQRRWWPIRYRDPDPRVQRDVVLATIPGTQRNLLADLWLPPEGVQSSGVALLFFHGSAWHFFDKGLGMDPTFRHLAAQGHVVLDVAYRLAPEADLVGMVGDVKRSVVWMRANGANYGVSQQRIVLCGASAGGQIALLAAYSPGDPELTPQELAREDTSVRGVVSYYGPADMRAYVSHDAGKLTRTGIRPLKKVSLRLGPMNLEQMMLNVMGGMPDEVPHAYDLAHVASHVTPKSPPTLLFQGQYDFIVQPQAVRELAASLRAAHVPVIYIEFPKTDHGFDYSTVFPKSKGNNLPIESQYAPPTESALYELDRFLALTASP
jgi:acetyl esterase/lipase